MIDLGLRAPTEDSVTSSGDTHNFGLRTLSSGSVISKSRTVYWEWFLQDPRSPLWQHQGFSFINQILLPNKISRDKKSMTALKSVQIDEQNISKLSYTGLGRLIALCQALGISDLHYENVLATEGPDNHLRINPIDIESIGNKFVLPSQTGLITKSSHSDYSTVGLHFLYTLKDDLRLSLIPQIVSGYLETFSDLTGKHYEDQLPIEDCEPVRIILRPTRGYYNYLEHKVGSTNFLPEEIIQLERGDIPYFFRLPNSTEIRWYTDPNGSSAILAPTDYLKRHQAKVKTFESIADVLEQSDSIKLAKSGALQIVLSLCTGLKQLNFPQMGGLKISLGENHLEIGYNNEVFSTKI